MMRILAGSSGTANGKMGLGVEVRWRVVCYCNTMGLVVVRWLGESCDAVSVAVVVL